MTEEELRAIIRDEIEEQALKEGGIYDECAKISFSMTRGIIENVARIAVNSFGPDLAHTPAREEHEKLT